MIKNSPTNAGDAGSIPESGKSPREGNVNSLQYSWLENPMDRGAWGAAVHGVTRVRHDLATNRHLGQVVLLFSFLVNFFIEVKIII